MHGEHNVGELQLEQTDANDKQAGLFVPTRKVFMLLRMLIVKLGLPPVHKELLLLKGHVITQQPDATERFEQERQERHTFFATK